MAKYVVMSFDDGRKDTYTNAIRIMHSSGLRASINITTGFIENPDKFTKFASADNMAMTISEVKQSAEWGFEIANHSDKHNNDIDNILLANSKLESWGIDIKNIGFASPFSYLNESNSSDVKKLINEGKISYIRSGIQVGRMPFWYKILYVLQDISKSAAIFRFLNKGLLIDSRKPGNIIYGISITKYTSLRQLKDFIDKIPDGKAAVFIFHSILEEDNPGCEKDKWFWRIDDFKALCEYLSNKNDTKVVNTLDLYRLNNL